MDEETAGVGGYDSTVYDFMSYIGLIKLLLKSSCIKSQESSFTLGTNGVCPWQHMLSADG